MGQVGRDQIPISHVTLMCQQTALGKPHPHSRPQDSLELQCPRVPQGWSLFFPGSVGIGRLAHRNELQGWRARGHVSPPSSRGSRCQGPTVAAAQ